MSFRNPFTPTLDGVIDRLQMRLNARATAATREWWTRYLVHHPQVVRALRRPSGRIGATTLRVASRERLTAETHRAGVSKDPKK
jgi:hypothetical protein